MPAAATHAAPWRRLVAPDRHPLKGSVAKPLSPSGVRRPASTIRGRVTTRAAAPGI
jgi:hypothetical protein